jgi:hypothetical protein
LGQHQDTLRIEIVREDALDTEVVEAFSQNDDSRPALAERSEVSLRIDALGVTRDDNHAATTYFLAAASSGFDS